MRLNLPLQVLMLADDAERGGDEEAERDGGDVPEEATTGCMGSGTSRPATPATATADTPRCLVRTSQ